MNPVEIVTIEKLIPIFKNGEPAQRIEVARIENCEFNIIVGKDLYKIGDKVVYIMPDYCLPDNDMFLEYWRPEGNSSKSALGKRGRIRAVKFNFQFENETDPIYSNGIVLPLDYLKQYGANLEAENLQEELGIIKYVSEDSHESSTQHKGLVEAPLPSFLYSTDEERIENHKKNVEKCYEEGEIIGLTLKKDGSSITIFAKKAPLEEGFVSGICSRKQEKKLDQKTVKRYIDTTSGAEFHPFFNKERKTRGWINDESGLFISDEEISEIIANSDTFEPVLVDVKDAWVDTCKDQGYYEKFVNYCKQYNVELAIRGELIGQGNKGSGNKLNKDAQGVSRVVWFGIDDLSTGFAKRIHYGQEHNLEKVCNELEMEYTEHILKGHFNYETLIKKCHEIFKEIKDSTGQVVEGIVIRTINSNKLSVKYINPEYDRFA